MGYLRVWGGGETNAGKRRKLLVEARILALKGQSIGGGMCYDGESKYRVNLPLLRKTTLFI